MTEGESLNRYIKSFRFNTKFLTYIIKPLNQDDWFFKPKGGGNDAHWNLGHLVRQRSDLLIEAGIDIKRYEWEHFFKYGNEPKEERRVVQPEELIKSFNDREQLISKHLSKIDGSTLLPKEEGEWEIWSEINTLSDMMQFYLFHEGYHMGQIGYVRRMLGNKRVV